MGLFKVLGGAAAGVGLIVLAPVFGAVGTVTAVGVAVGTAVGGIAGAVASDKDKENSAYNRGKEQGKSENLSEMEALKSKFEKASRRFEEYKDFENYLLACYAVGISVAYCDGNFAEEEKNDLEEFIQGVSFQNYPNTFKEGIQNLYDNPPTFNEAKTFVKKVNKSDWSIFSDIIEIIIASDNIERNEERVYREAWKEFMSA